MSLHRLLLIHINFYQELPLLIYVYGTDKIYEEFQVLFFQSI